MNVEDYIHSLFTKDDASFNLIRSIKGSSIEDPFALADNICLCELNVFI